MSILFDNPLPAIGCGDPGDPIDFGVQFTGAGHLSCAVTAANTKQAVIDYSFKDCSAGGTAHLHVSTVLGANGNYFYVGVNDSGNYTIFHGPNDAILFSLSSVGKLRGKATHYHAHVRIDTTLAVASDRVQLWLGGRRMILTGTFPVQNADMTFIGGSQTHYIGSWLGTPGSPGGGADVIISRPIYEDSVTPQLSAFGYFNAYGHWVMKAYSQPAVYNLTFSNGLELGADETGTHDFVSSGLTVDSQVADTPFRNKPTLDPFNKAGSEVLTKGNLHGYSPTINLFTPVGSTMLLPRQGKWYFKISVIDITGATASSAIGVGQIGNGTKPFPARQNGTDSLGVYSEEIAYRYSGTILRGNVTVATVDGFDNGDDIYCGVDRDSGTVSFWNGSTLVWSGSHVFSDGVLHFFAADFDREFTADFGGDTGSAPEIAGFLPLSSENIPCPEILTPDDYFTTRKVGDITPLPWNPLVHKTLAITKDRDGTTSWRVNDTVRGDGLAWACDVGGLEINEGGAGISWTSDGPVYGASAPYQGNRFTWFYRASPLAGFDIVEINHVNGIASTVPHNVGGLIQYAWEVPLDGGDVLVFHHHLAAGEGFKLNDQAPAAPVSGGTITFTANTVTVPASRATGRIILYLWRGVPDFSVFLLVPGNSSADGPLLPADFTPLAAHLRNVDTTTHLAVMDTSRSAENPAQHRLLFGDFAQESTSLSVLDFYGLGAKLVVNSTAYNQGRVAVALWAEVPGKFARAR